MHDIQIELPHESPEKRETIRRVIEATAEQRTERIDLAGREGGLWHLTVWGPDGNYASAELNLAELLAAEVLLPVRLGDCLDRLNRKPGS